MWCAQYSIHGCLYPDSDFDNFGNYIQNHPNHINVEIVDLKNIATDLSDGKIIGVARGRSEHGPRALGNRSILCNPAIKEMKDILNKKVKNREWYRPFAPVVRLEDVSTYFEWQGERHKQEKDVYSSKTRQARKQGV